jgi:hypothetical protein
MEQDKMMPRASRAGLVVVSLALSSAAFGQGGGFSGSFGAGGFGGGFGGGAGGGGNSGGREQDEPPDPATAIPGEWQIEFRIERDSADSRARGRWISVTADLTVSGTQVTGRIRDRDAEGDFECSISPVGRCEQGRLRFTTDTEDWQDFGFVLDDRDSDRAEGWATFVDSASGQMRDYELIMRKR